MFNNNFNNSNMLHGLASTNFNADWGLGLFGRPSDYCCVFDSYYSKVFGSFEFESIPFISDD